MIKTMRSDDDCGQSDYEREQQGKFSEIVTKIVIMISNKQGKFSLLTCSFSERPCFSERQREKLQRKKEKARVL